MWTDSTVVLSWLRDHPSRWKSFIANRVTQIQEVYPPSHWHHIPGKCNPADLASRGMLPNDLLDSCLWWKGPSFLSSSFELLPDKQKHSLDKLALGEEKRKNLNVNLMQIPEDHPLFRFSSLSRLQRTLAWCYRFARNCRASKPTSGPLSVSELHDTLHIIIKRVQEEAFQGELKSCASNRELPRKSKLLSLNPFLDERGILRVGGRLQAANLAFDKKFPMILPKSHHLTRLIILNAHHKSLHGGLQSTITILQQQYWIVGCRDVTRKIIHQCTTCFRHRGIIQQQLMGDLPAHRIQPCRTFLRTGVDYAGPLKMKTTLGRGSRTTKGYIALFTCLATRAIHLELVSDMTTAAFLAAFRRFVSRRGLCSEVFSDCGSNFIGAKHELAEFYRLIRSQGHNDYMQQALSSDSITWSTIPPGSPYFGGTWESGVKSTKHHLRRIVGDTSLTFEEMSTVLCQIEACLNSRPLCGLSSDPNDLSTLTPGHFIIGSPISAVPEPNLMELKLNRLSRWQLVQRLTQHFWTRWATEYITRLQQRPKWKKTTENLKINDLVLVKDERLPPLKWNLGRIVQTHPGHDNLVRVCTVKTVHGEFKRSISKLCKLPLDD